MKRILCIGDACADLTIPYGAAKKGDDRAEPKLYPGGSVANTASGLGRLGVDCAFFGKAGKDYYGREMRRALKDDGVDVASFLLDDNCLSTQILVVIDEHGDRFPFLMPRQAPGYLQLFPEEFPKATDFDAVFTSGLMLFEEPAAANICDYLERCRDIGVKVFVDINLRLETRTQDRAYLMRALNCADFVFASLEDDLIPLTGIEDPDEAAKQLVTEKRTVIVRMGAKGARVYTANSVSHCGGFPVEVADTLGAGDCYNSGFLYALSKGRSVEDANICACAAAAMGITKTGARNCPDEAALMEFLTRRGMT